MREANSREAAGEDIIHMEVGQPGTPAPRLVREAVKRAIDHGPLGYTDALGLPSLREKISAYYRDVWNVSVSPSRIVITTGSSAGFVLAFLALLNPGDGVALPAPGYPCYRQIARVLGITPVSMAARADKAFMPSANDLRQIFKDGAARAALFASPQIRLGPQYPERS